jgi:hypothetical protein
VVAGVQVARTTAGEDGLAERGLRAVHLCVQAQTPPTKLRPALGGLERIRFGCGWNGIQDA